MIVREGLRYLVAGGANTAVTYALYLALLQVLDYRLAYALAFVAGIGLSFVLLRHLVFARRGKRHSLAWLGPASCCSSCWACWWCRPGSPGCRRRPGWRRWRPSWCACR